MLDTNCFPDKLHKNNLSMFYFVPLEFIANILFETNHKYFSFDENKNIIKFKKRIWKEYL